MTPGTHVFLSGLLTFGVPLALAVYELIALRRPGDGPGRPDAPRPRDPEPPPPPGRQARSRPLPACLVEAARTDPAARATHKKRALEPA